MQVFSLFAEESSQDTKQKHGCTPFHSTSFPEVDISLHQQDRTACTSVVAPGDFVYVGQVIARSDHPMAVPIHSSVSGIVKELHHVVSPVGEPIEAIRIESDGKYTDDPTLAPPVIESREDFLAAVRACGLVGLGGASFPTHIKLNPPAGKKPNILLINAAECEPYITSDYRMICENPDQIIDGILAVMKWVDIPTAIIGYEDNKPLVNRIFDHELGKRVFKTGEKHDIKIQKMRTIYPQGAEKMFIYALTGRKEPSGKLPHDVSVLVLNVTTVQVGSASYTSEPHAPHEKAHHSGRECPQYSRAILTFRSERGSGYYRCGRRASRGADQDFDGRTDDGRLSGSRGLRHHQGE